MQNEFENLTKTKTESDSQEDKTINAFANFSYKNGEELEGINKYLLSEEEIRLREIEEQKKKEEYEQALINQKLNKNAPQIVQKSTTPNIEFSLKSEEQTKQLKSRVKFYAVVYFMVVFALALTAIVTAFQLIAVNADIKSNEKAIEVIERQANS